MAPITSGARHVAPGFNAFPAGFSLAVGLHFPSVALFLHFGLGTVFLGATASWEYGTLSLSLLKFTVKSSSWILRETLNF